MSKLFVWFGGFFLGAVIFDGVAWNLSSNSAFFMVLFGCLMTIGGLALGRITPLPKKGEKDETTD